jgi:hypothetical protein
MWAEARHVGRNLSGHQFLIRDPHFLAVREEDEGHTELIGIAPALRFARAQIDAGALWLPAL